MKLKTLVLCLCCAIASLLGAQSGAEIELRFANPVFQHSNRTYSVDVEMKSRSTNESLFGINTRFFFDASLLSFSSFHDFHPGYNILGEEVKSFVGNEVSGSKIFDLPHAAGYVNGAVQLMDDRYPLHLYPHKWVKVFRISFSVPKNIPDEASFCPSLIWDQKTYGQRGGFLGGSDGVIVTVMEKNRDTRQESLPTNAVGHPFNWQYKADVAQPHGHALATDCINIAELVATENPDQVNGAGYALFQNQPNPFDVRTSIDFILPEAQEAKLIFYNAEGKILEEVKGFYEAGRNSVELKLKPWMTQSNVFYYRLQTEKYTSDARSLNVVRA